MKTISNIGSIRIGKTVYPIISSTTTDNHQRMHWQLDGGCQVKSLFWSRRHNTYTLWSARNGMHAGAGKPKVVSVEFLSPTEAAI
jgi:hypothetical protein